MISKIKRVRLLPYLPCVPAFPVRAVVSPYINDHSFWVAGFSSMYFQHKFIPIMSQLLWGQVHTLITESRDYCPCDCEGASKSKNVSQMQGTLHQSLMLWDREARKRNCLVVNGRVEPLNQSHLWCGFSLSCSHLLPLAQKSKC